MIVFNREHYQSLCGVRVFTTHTDTQSESGAPSETRLKNAMLSVRVILTTFAIAIPYILIERK